MSPLFNSTDMTTLHSMSSSIPFRAAAFAFMLTVAIRPNWVLYVARGFRHLPTSKFGLTTLRVIAVFSLVQIIVGIVAPGALGPLG